MALMILSPALPMRLKLPCSANFMRICFSRRSSSCCRLAARHLDASDSAPASCFVASASQTIFSSCHLPSIIISSAFSSASTFTVLAAASALAVSEMRQVSSCILVRSSCVLVSRSMTSTLDSASMSAILPSSSALTLFCSNSSSALFFLPLSETSTCSPFLRISSICISDSCLIRRISNSFSRSSLSMAFSIFVVISRLRWRLSGSQMEVTFTSENRTPHSVNLWFRICSIVSAVSPRRV
mmetsp:Transcript_34254/g.102360  ORF Transcript_34254/g.102360 Transcript_34254/m.102360 type:complete len:241 (+) Transcript_34254:267-989(+)